MTRTVEFRGAERIEITTRSGRLEVIAEADRVNVEIDGLQERSRKRQVWREHGRLHIRSGRGSDALTVRCPAGTDLSAASSSGRIELRGDLGDVRLHSHSGQITVEQARSVEARTKNGRIRIGSSHGRASAASASGQVDVQRARSAGAATVSGGIKLEDVRGTVNAMSVSGSVSIQTRGAGDIRVGTVSGSVEVRVPTDRQPKLQIKQKSGSQKIDCAEGDDLTIAVATLSGSVRIGTHRQRVKT